MKFAVIAVIFLAAPAVAQQHERLPNLDFEEGLRGWRATGGAFARQPV